MRITILLTILAMLTSCEKNEPQAVAARVEVDNSEQSKPRDLLGASEEAVEKLIVKGMKREAVLQILAEPNSSADFLGELKDDYDFLDDFPNFPPSGTLIGISVYYEKNLVTRWTGHWQGGAYRKEEDGSSTRQN